MTEQPLSLTVAQALELDLKRKELTQEQLGTQLGVSQQAISGWIKDNRVPAGRLQSVLAIFGNDSHTAALLRRNMTYREVRSGAHRAPADVQFSNEGPATGPGALGAAAVEPRRYNLREHTIDWAFVDALPEYLRRNAQEARVQFGSSSRRLDYVSDKVALELVAPSITNHQFPQTRVAPSMVRLAVVKQATLEKHPGRLYILGVILQPTSSLNNARAMQALATDAELLGLTLATTSDVTSLARYVTEIEEGRLPFDNEDEALPPDGPDDAQPVFGDLISHLDLPRKTGESDS